MGPSNGEDWTGESTQSTTTDAEQDTADIETTAGIEQPEPQRSPRKLLLGLVAGGLIALTCVGVVIALAIGRVGKTVAPVFQNASIFAGEPALNQIAFVGNDDNIWLASPDGEQLRQLTSNGQGYNFPTWAPDGRRVAFIGPDAEGNTALYVSSATDIDPSIFFASPNSAPFYLYWAPDSHSLTFLTQETSGLSMRLVDTSTPGDKRVLATGAPFYWVWSPNSDRMLMHVGGARAISSDAHLSVLANREDAQRIELDLAPGRFQAPLWSANGQHIFYIASNSAGQDFIYQTDPDTLEQISIADVADVTYMAVSPDDRYLAYLEVMQGSAPPLGAAYLISLEDGGGDRKQIMDDLVMSMYWSPDGSKLAVLAPGFDDDGSVARAGGLMAPLPQELVFRWWIYDVEAGTLEPLISFNPTRDFLQTVPFFDQYHLSLTFWSPDSRYFVVAKADDDSREGTIWVVDTTGQEADRQIGEGTLAVWSWR
ncbi:MAG: hypothetical protein ACE5H9_00250 [Anaerolineae bacterium]